MALSPIKEMTKSHETGFVRSLNKALEKRILEHLEKEKAVDDFDKLKIKSTDPITLPGPPEEIKPVVYSDRQKKQEIKPEDRDVVEKLIKMCMVNAEEIERLKKRLKTESKRGWV